MHDLYRPWGILNTEMREVECVGRYLDTIAKGAIGENIKITFFIPSSSMMMTTSIGRFSGISRIQWSWMAFIGDLEQEQNPLKCIFLQTQERNTQGPYQITTLTNSGRLGSWNKNRKLLFISSTPWDNRWTLV